MHTTLVINPKGGSGKTTVTVNLASYFAATGVPTAVMDYDPQGSSLNWLSLRPPHAKQIRTANAARQRATPLRSMAMYVPPDTQQLIIDAPAGACGMVLQEMLERASCILVPVTPSTIDIHATANFVKETLLTQHLQARKLPIGVVANKVRRSMPSYAPLQWFLNSLNLKLIARLVDSDVYLKVAEAGIGIYDMDPNFSASERQQFAPIGEWILNQRRGPDARPDANVYELSRTRFA
jgi:chromosome partitioning protein